jgi:hypothetical protein
MFQKGNKVGKQFQPGQVANPDGRPAKFVTSIKRSSGAKDSQIVECLRTLISLNPEELEEHLKEKEITILEKIVGRALLDDFKEHKQYNLMEQLKLILPKPKETIDHTMTVVHTTKFTLPGGNTIEIP